MGIKAELLGEGAVKPREEIPTILARQLMCPPRGSKRTARVIPVRSRSVEQGRLM